MDIIEFNPSHIDEAASLLAVRHVLERKVNPELPAKFEEVAYTKKQL